MPALIVYSIRLLHVLRVGMYLIDVCVCLVCFSLYHTHTHTHSLSQAQHVCLDTLTLDSLFHTRNMFVSWAEDGLYDFCSLPFGVKKQMSIADDDKLTQLPGRFEGTAIARECKALWGSLSKHQVTYTNKSIVI